MKTDSCLKPKNNIDYIRRIPSYKQYMSFISIIACIVLLLPGCDNQEVYKPPDQAVASPSAIIAPLSTLKQQIEEEEPQSVRLLFTGDVMVHEPQLLAQFDNQTMDYDFTNNYMYVKYYISSAALAMCNLETTLGGSPYKGYPMFSSPDSLADALVSAGFNAVFTSNNHMLDRSIAGFYRTIETLRAFGLQNAGSQFEAEDNFLLISAGALNIGVVSYTYESARSNGRRTLNGIPIPAELSSLVNSYGFEEFDNDILRIEKTVAEARNGGADFVVCYFHWGYEYQRTHDEHQRQIAYRVAQAGADLIVASHPHVLQGMEIYEINGKKIPVYYSMGNFISNQRTDTTGSRFTEQGLMVIADIRYKPDSLEIVSLDTKVIPTWLDKYRKGDKNYYTIIPLTGDFMENPTLVESNHGDRAKQALEYCISLYGEDQILKE